MIAYGPDVKESELPDSPLGLTDPKWKGRVGWSPGHATRCSSTSPRCGCATATTSPASGSREMVDQRRPVEYPDNVSIRDAIANGEIDVGLINHYYVAQAVAAEGPDYPVKVYFPPKGLGSLLLLTSVGVLESSDRKDEAFDFIRALLSNEGQQYFTSSSKEYPLAKGVPAGSVADGAAVADPAARPATSPTSARPRRRSS